MADTQETPLITKSVNDNGHQLFTEQELAARGEELQKSFLGSMFPILGVELSRFFVMAITFITIAFVYTFLRIYKDNIIYSTLEPAAQNYLKIFTAPVTFLFIGVLNKLLIRYDIDKTFEIGTIGFIGVLGVLAFLIKIRIGIQANEYWAMDVFIMDSAALRGLRPLYVFALIWNNWVLSLLYILSDVVGSIMVGYFFMTYVNAHCTPDQNKRFVRILYICSNLSGFFAGRVMEYWSKSTKNMSRNMVEGFYFWFTLASAACFVLIFLFKKLLDYIFRTNPLIVSSGKAKKSKVKKSVGILDGFYYAWVSRLLWAMCSMTLAYNIINTFITSLFTNANKSTGTVMNYLSTFGTERKSQEASATAIATVIVLLTPVSRLFEWFGVASSGGLPIIIASSGIILTCVMAAINYPLCGEDNMRGFQWLAERNKHPKAESWIGLVTLSAVKVSKYAFFDIVKEAIGMKINPEIRPLFKSVFDGLCGKAGKFLGSVYHIAMENITDGVLDARYYAPVTLIVSLILCVWWAYSIYYLHYSYKKAVETNSYISPDYIKGSNLKDE